LSSIDAEACEDCASLSSISIPSSVQTLKEACFRGCQSLSTITFEAGFAPWWIASDAFQDCTSLSSLFMPRALADAFPWHWRGLNVIIVTPPWHRSGVAADYWDTADWRKMGTANRRRTE
jgi:hypothetical protein